MNVVTHVLDIFNLPVVYLEDGVPHLESRPLCRGAGCYHVDTYWPYYGLSGDHQARAQQDYGQQQVHERARAQNDQARPDAFTGKAPLLFGVFFAQQLHEAAQGQDVEGIVRSLVFDGEKAGRVPKAEFLDCDARHLGGHKMAQLVHHHEHQQDAEERDDINQKFGHPLYLRTVKAHYPVKKLPLERGSLVEPSR